ncbi:MAG: hypothetical protein ABIR08_01845 [Sphingomonas sp.]
MATGAEVLAGAEISTRGQSNRRSFPAYHRHDRNFFLAMTAISWLAVLSGFGPELFDHARGASPFPGAIVLIHGAAFFLWLILFTAQVLLIRARKLKLHRTLGLAAVVLIPVMVVLGFEANVMAQRAHFLAGQSQLNFMIVPIIDMILFGGFGAAAVLMHKRPAAHKRLMLLALISLLDAGFGRSLGPWLLDRAGDGFVGFWMQLFLGPDLMIVAAMAYDAATRRRIHPVYLIGLPTFLTAQLASSAIYHAPGWIPIARYLIS